MYFSFINMHFTCLISVFQYIHRGSQDSSNVSCLLHIQYDVSNLTGSPRILDLLHSQSRRKSSSVWQGIENCKAISNKLGIVWSKNIITLDFRWRTPEAHPNQSVKYLKAMMPQCWHHPRTKHRTVIITVRSNRMQKLLDNASLKAFVG